MDTALEWTTVGATAAALLVFLVRTGRRAQPSPSTEVDFGVVFGAFLAAWVGTELFEVFAVPAIQEVGHVVHLVLLASLAVWLNARFYSVLKEAKEAT